DLNKFVSEFGRKNEDIGKYKQEIEQLRAQAEKKVEFAELTPDQKELAKQQLKSVFGDEIMTKQDYRIQRQVEKITEECDSYESEIDGSDGRPKFEREKVLEHMKNPDVPKNILKAYKDLYEKELDDWRQKQLTAAKPKGFYTETGLPGTKEPHDVKVTNDNVDRLFYEAVHGGT